MICCKIAIFSIMLYSKFGNIGFTGTWNFAIIATDNACMYHSLTCITKFYMSRLHYDIFRFLKNRCIPFSVLKTRLWDIRVGFDGSSSNMNLLSTRAIVVFISFMAKCCPMQFRGPAENGMKACESISFMFSGRKRSGS